MDQVRSQTGSGGSRSARASLPLVSEMSWSSTSSFCFSVFHISRSSSARKMVPSWLTKAARPAQHFSITHTKNTNVAWAQVAGRNEQTTRAGAGAPKEVVVSPWGCAINWSTGSFTRKRASKTQMDSTVTTVTRVDGTTMDVGLVKQKFEIEVLRTRVTAHNSTTTTSTSHYIRLTNSPNL